jgi:hypothetical protein
MLLRNLVSHPVNKNLLDVLRVGTLRSGNNDNVAIIGLLALVDVDRLNGLDGTSSRL